MRKNFGEFLKKLRLDRGMTLRDVEKKTGISNAYLSQIENNKRGMPHSRTLEALAPAFGLTLLDLVALLSDEDDPNRTLFSTKGDKLRGEFTKILGEPSISYEFREIMTWEQIFYHIGMLAGRNDYDDIQTRLKEVEAELIERDQVSK